MKLCLLCCLLCFGCCFLVPSHALFAVEAKPLTTMADAACDASLSAHPSKKEAGKRFRKRRRPQEGAQSAFFIGGLLLGLLGGWLLRKGWVAMSLKGLWLTSGAVLVLAGVLCVLVALAIGGVPGFASR